MNRRECFPSVLASEEPKAASSLPSSSSLPALALGTPFSILGSFSVSICVWPEVLVSPGSLHPLEPIVCPWGSCVSSFTLALMCRGLLLRPQAGSRGKGTARWHTCSQAWAARMSQDRRSQGQHSASPCHLLTGLTPSPLSASESLRLDNGLYLPSLAKKSKALIFFWKMELAVQTHAVPQDGPHRSTTSTWL